MREMNTHTGFVRLKCAILNYDSAGGRVASFP